LSNFFSVFATTCSEFCQTLFLPIDLEADLEESGDLASPAVASPTISPRCGGIGTRSPICCS
jgi:hypothetical protein